MPKKPIFQESNEETLSNRRLAGWEKVIPGNPDHFLPTDEAMTNLLKKLITQTTEQKPKPKQKRVISEERRQQLREQLIKGREMSIKSRSKENKKPEESKPMIEIKPVEAKPQTQDLSKLETKFDSMLDELKQLNQLSKETLEHKKAKKKIKEEKEVEKEFLLFKKKEKKEETSESKPTQPTPQPAQPPAPKIPKYYFIPHPKNNTLF